MSNKARNIFFLIGLVAVILMVVTFDISLSDLWHHIQTAGYWLPVILVLWIVLYMMNALTWRVLILGSGDCPINYWRLLKWTITGFALNTATPVGLLGGEPYKIMEAKTYIGTQRATSSVVLFSMMHVFSHFCFWGAAIVLYLLLAALGILPLDTLLCILITLMGLFSAAGLYFFMLGYRYGLVLRLIHWVGHIPGLKKWATSFADTHADDLNEIDRQISELHAQRREHFYAAWTLEFTGRAMQSLEIFFILLLFEAGDASLLTFIYSFIILAFTSLFANLLFIIPLQLGGREGGFAMSVAQMGMTAAVGFFISLICRVREIFFTVIGLLLMKIKNQ